MPLLESIKYCMNCGHATELREESGRLRPVCPNCGNVHYFAPLVAVAVIIVREDGRFLLVQRGEDPGKGLWGLPGGYVEADETLTNALSREILEETSLELEVGEIIGVWSFYNDYKELSGAVIVYSARIQSGNLQLGSDSVAAEWVGFSELNRFVLAFDTHRDALRKWNKSTT